MSNTSKNKNVTHFVQNIFFELFYLLVKICPLSFGLFLGKTLGYIAYLLIKQRRQITLDNIEHAKSNGFLKDAPDTHTLARQVWQHLGMLGSEFLYYYSHDPEELAKRVTIEGEDYLKEVLTKGKGAIMATAHVGNWELLGLYLSAKGYPLCPLVKTQKNPFFDKIVQSKRESIGMKTIPRSGFLRPILKAFQRNEIVPFIMDQYDYNGIKVNFFGREASFPAGTAEFFHKTGTPIIYMYIYRESKYRHHIVVSKAFEPNSTGDVKADIRDVTAHLANIIQNTIEKHPSQWLWMHKLWKKRR